MQIFIDTFYGKTIVLDCEPNDTIYHIREKIWDKFGAIPCADYSLIYSGKCLHNKRTLADYNIQKESKIRMTKIGTGHQICHVIYDNQNKITINKACLICVKREIESIFGIKYECQEFIVDGEIVDDEEHNEYALSNETVILKLKLPSDYKK